MSDYKIRTKKFEIGKNGLTELKETELQLGQVVWLNHSHYFRKDWEMVIYKKTRLEYDNSLQYHLVSLDDYRTKIIEAGPVKSEDDIFGIGWYYTPGKVISVEELIEAVMKIETAAREAKEKADKEAAIKKAAEEKRRAELLKEWGSILTAKADWQRSEHTLVSKNTRIILKKFYPGVKFRVTAEWDSVNIEWTNGPTYDEIQTLLCKFKSGHFDLHLDYYQNAPSIFNELFGGVRYVSTYRSVTADKYVELAKKHNLSDYRVIDNRFSIDSFENERFLNSQISETSFYVLPEKGKKNKK